MLRDVPDFLDMRDWAWTHLFPKEMAVVVLTRFCMPGKIFDSIIGYLQHPEIGRARFESAIFTYLIVLALQGAFSRSAVQLVRPCPTIQIPRISQTIGDQLFAGVGLQRRGGLKSLAQELVQRRMAMSVRMKLFASVIRMDIAFFDTMHTGQLTSRMTNDVSPLAPTSTTMGSNFGILVHVQ